MILKQRPIKKTLLLKRREEKKREGKKVGVGSSSEQTKRHIGERVSRKYIMFAQINRSISPPPHSEGKQTAHLAGGPLAGSSSSCQVPVST